MRGVLYFFFISEFNLMSCLGHIWSVVIYFTFADSNALSIYYNYVLDLEDEVLKSAEF